MAKKQSDGVMTIDELAAYLKLSKSTLYKLCQDGKVPGQKVGRHWRFHKAVIDHWLGVTGEKDLMGNQDKYSNG